MRFSRPLFSYLTAMLLGSTLSACAYIIPPSQNEPRNNTVQGEIRKPTNNPGASGKRSDVTPRELPTAAPVMPVQQASLPPLGEASGRRAPVENAQFQISSNSYPAINSVPEAPPTRGSDSAQSRLSATQAELEVDRSKAITASKALAKDAAAEPSMLSELPKVDGVVPTSDPIQVAPVTPQTPVVSTPEPQVIPTQIRRLPATEVPRSSLTPITTARPVASIATSKPIASIAPAIEISTAAPAASSSLPNLPVFAPPVTSARSIPNLAPRVETAVAPTVKPVSVTPQTQSFTVDLSPSTPTPTITAQALPAPTASAPNIRAGDFDPLAAADNAPISAPVATAPRTPSSAYVSNRYIPPSRYSGLRN